MRIAKGIGRGLVCASALAALVACAQGPKGAGPSSPKKGTERPDPFGHSAIACRACGAFVDGQTALTFQGTRSEAPNVWLYDAASPCIARAKRDGWSLEGDLQVEVTVRPDGAPKHACGAHKAMDPRLATCLLDAFDARVPREPKERTFATWIVPRDLAAKIPPEAPPEPPIAYDDCLGDAPPGADPTPTAKQAPVDGFPSVRSCGQTGRVEGADKVIAAARPMVRRCYQSGLNAAADMEGRVAFFLDLASDGSVGRVCRKVTGTLSPEVAGCISAALKGLSFEAPTGGHATVGGSFSFVNETKRRRETAQPPPPPPSPRRQASLPWPWPVWVR